MLKCCNLPELPVPTFFNVSQYPTFSQQYIDGLSRDLTIGAHRETCLACFWVFTKQWRKHCEMETLWHCTPRVRTIGLSNRVRILVYTVLIFEKNVRQEPTWFAARIRHCPTSLIGQSKRSGGIPMGAFRTVFSNIHSVSVYVQPI
jgi:hypothetical protein